MQVVARALTDSECYRLAFLIVLPHRLSPFAPLSARLYAFSRTYLFSPDSRVNVCPTSMQDGAVRVLELYGTPAQRSTYIPRLLAREQENVWVAGQWMTERPGGSDVAQTETKACRMENVASGKPDPVNAKGGQGGKPGDLYLLEGFKWFSSCPDGDMSLALARTSLESNSGSSGLSLFLVPLRKSGRPPIPAHLRHLIQDDVTNPHNDYNGIRVHRLKKKLGTELVPTAELELDGRSCVGELIGQEGRGVFYIASVLNLTRLYSASGSCAAIGFALNIASDWATKRKVEATREHPQGLLLSENAMHIERLTRVSVTHRALLGLVFSTIKMLSFSEVGRLSQADELRLRLLTPVSKAFAALRGTECYVQCIEALGGQGYMVENLLGDVLKSATVERIWEGTPSVLSHDVKRVLVKTKGAALGLWLQSTSETLTSTAMELGEQAQTREIAEKLGEALKLVYESFLTEDRKLTPLVNSGRACRALLELIGIVQSGIALLEQAAWSASFASGKRAPALGLETGNAAVDLEAARRWVLGAEGNLLEALREFREAATLYTKEGQGSVNQVESLNKEIVFAGRNGTPVQQIERELGSSGAIVSGGQGMQLSGSSKL